MKGQYPLPESLVMGLTDVPQGPRACFPVSPLPHLLVTVSSMAASFCLCVVPPWPEQAGTLRHASWVVSGVHFWVWVLGVNGVLAECPPPGSCHQGHRCPRPQCEYLLPAVA